MTLDMDKEKFKRRFPKLSEEINDPSLSDTTDEAEEEGEAPSTGDAPARAPIEQKKPIRNFDGYNPTAVDFIRRCGSEKEAQEIIDYMERSGEIGRSEAQQMRSQLRAKGLRSFGAKKEYGYYLKNLE